MALTGNQSTSDIAHRTTRRLTHHKHPVVGSDLDLRATHGEVGHALVPAAPHLLHQDGQAVQTLAPPLLQHKQLHSRVGGVRAGRGQGRAE